MYRIVLACEGIPPELGPTAAIDVSEEFSHRQWHQNVRCEWDRSRLLLYAERTIGMGMLKLSSMSFQMRFLPASKELSDMASRSYPSPLRLDRSSWNDASSLEKVRAIRDEIRTRAQALLESEGLAGTQP